MKRIKISMLGLLLAAISFTACNNYDYSEKFSFLPENPGNSNEVTILYNPAGTKLADAEKITAVVYQFDSELLKADEIELAQDGIGWYGKFKTDNSSQGALIMFTSDEIIDNNEGNAYVVEMFTEQGKSTPRFLAGLAAAKATWIRNLEIDADQEKAYEMFVNIFEKSPDLKSDFLATFLWTIQRVKGEEAKEIILGELKEFQTKVNLTDEDYDLLLKWYGTLKMETEAKSISGIALQKFPNGKAAERTEYMAIAEIKDKNLQRNEILNFVNKYPESDFNEPLAYSVLRAAVDEKDFNKAASATSDFYNSLHPYYFGYAVNKLLKEKGDLNLALSIAERGLKKAKAAAEKPESEKPAQDLLKDFNNSRNYYYANSLETLGKVQNLLGKKEEALKNYEASIPLFDQSYESATIGEEYSSLLVELEKYEKALKYLSDVVKSGSATQSMLVNLEKSFVAVNGKDKDYSSYLSELKGKAASELMTKLKNEIIEEPAPDFTLTDLNGKSVSLNELKGKTVIVDFWATWCGPCKSSFPGMKKTVEKFKDNENVEFLFVNTWERVDDKAKNARDFIKQNNYPFHVLIDDQNKVVSNFKVQGIPTKFIIDKNSNIRFKSVGFSGTDEHLVDELSAMISIIE